MTDLDAIRGRHESMRHYFDAQDEAEFSIFAADAFENGDTPALLAEVERLTAERDAARAEVVALGKELEAVRISACAAVSKAHREAGTW